LIFCRIIFVFCCNIKTRFELSNFCLDRFSTSESNKLFLTYLCINFPFFAIKSGMAISWWIMLFQTLKLNNENRKLKRIDFWSFWVFFAKPKWFFCDVAFSALSLLQLKVKAIFCVCVVRRLLYTVRKSNRFTFPRIMDHWMIMNRGGPIFTVLAQSISAHLEHTRRFR